MSNSEDKVQDVEDDSWVFDSLVNFLDGPIWKLPVVGFLEEKSVVFDPDSYSNMSEENEVEYRRIHEEYKELVDYMLGSFMEDLQVTAEQVEDACQVKEQSKLSQPTHSHVTKMSLEQLWAAEDFNSFRKLMTRKNIDLQLQSLELLVAKYGVLSPSLRNSTDELGESNGEEDFLQVVIRYADPTDLFQNAKTLEAPHSTPAVSFDDPGCSEQDYQNLHHIVSTRNQNQLTKELLSIKFNVSQSQTQLSNVSSAVSPTALHSRSQIRKQENADCVDENIREYNQNPDGISCGPTSTQVELNQVAVEALTSDASQQFRHLTSLKQALEIPDDDDMTAPGDTPQTISGKRGVALNGSESEIQQRRDYLRAQRDKLVALKKSEREKQLAREDNANGPSRPKSARAAQNALTSGPLFGASNERSLAARRAIALRLKQEFIDK